MQEIVFTKMHGLGNDYVYIDCRAGSPSLLPQLAIEMSAPHTGIGSDGIILILPSEVADFRMRIFNADGSEAKMCGNGSRCVGKYVYDNHLTDKLDITLETLGGIKRLQLHPGPDGKIDTVTVNMGVPELTASRVPVVAQGERMIEQPVNTDDGECLVTAVSMGNPHGVIFTDNIADLPLSSIGPRLECHSIWPDRANIEWARVVDRHTIEMRVWERGSGETMACGTGACAVATAAIITGRCDSPVSVTLPGGQLHIEMLPSNDPSTPGEILMTGPATTVFTGRYFRR